MDLATVELDYRNDRIRTWKSDANLLYTRQYFTSWVDSESFSSCFVHQACLWRSSYQIVHSFPLNDKVVNFEEEKTHIKAYRYMVLVHNSKCPKDWEPFWFSSPGSLNLIAQVFLGYQAGQIILCYSGHRQRITRFLGWGVGTAVVGMVLCNCKLNTGWIPINKNLW